MFDQAIVLRQDYTQDISIEKICAWTFTIASAGEWSTFEIVENDLYLSAMKSLAENLFWFN